MKISPQITQIPIFLSLMLIGSPLPALSQDSVINKVMTFRQSVVDISAMRIETKASPKASAAFDPNTGKILVARNVKQARLEKKGAGVVLNSNGYIVTNFHTIMDTNMIGVKIFQGKSYLAKIIHVNPQDDLALLKIDPKEDLSPVSFGDSNALNLRDPVINIGNSSMLRNSLIGGVISGLGRKKGVALTDGSPVEVIKVNIDLYKGDSGGPLLNRNGELIGMIVAKNRRKERTSFAIPSNKIKNLYLSYSK